MAVCRVGIQVSLAFGSRGEQRAVQHARLCGYIGEPELQLITSAHIVIHCLHKSIEFVYIDGVIQVCLMHWWQVGCDRVMAVMY